MAKHKGTVDEHVNAYATFRDVESGVRQAMAYVKAATATGGVQPDSARSVLGALQADADRARDSALVSLQQAVSAGRAGAW